MQNRQVGVHHPGLTHVLSQRLDLDTRKSTKGRARARGRSCDIGCPEKEAGITRKVSSIVDSRTGSRVGRTDGLYRTDVPCPHGSGPAPGTSQPSQDTSDG